MFQPPSSTILKKEITSPDQQCNVFDQDFQLLGIFGEGGGSYLINAVVNNDIPVLGLYEGQYVAIKLCKGDILDIIGCNEYIKEANLMRIVTVLNREGICYNFPIYYMYGKCCLFYRKEQYNNISNRLPEDCDLPYDKTLQSLYGIREAVVPDLLIHYANTEFSQDLSEKTKANYGSVCLDKIKQLFQLENFQVLGKKWNINLRQPDVDKAEIYNFIVGDSDVNCGNYIVMSKIPGSPLDKLGSGYVLRPDLVFEMMYSNACLIKHYGFVLSDRHDDNVMIADTDIPRIYKLGDYYIYFDTSTMYYSIDLQATTNKQFTSVRDLITIGSNHLSNDMINTLELLSKGDYTLDQFITEVLPVIYKNYIISVEDVYRKMKQDPRIQIAEYK